MSTSADSTTSTSIESTTNSLKQLKTIKQKCNQIFNLGLNNKLTYWTLDLSQEQPIINFIHSLIERDYGKNNYSSIPPHGRLRHFTKNRIQPLLTLWDSQSIPKIEQTRRLIDLLMVSVLLDAGAGNDWNFTAKDGEKIGRSEGLAVGSLELFELGGFSSDSGNSFQVDSIGLSLLTPSILSTALQVTSSNPMTGLEGRASLLVKLSSVISSEENSKYFKSPTGENLFRPGFLVDYLLAHPSTVKTGSNDEVGREKLEVDINTMWNIIITGLNPIWPETNFTTKLNGINLGDCWKCESLNLELEKSGVEREVGDDFVPFHKLSQWLTYSLIEVMESHLPLSFPSKSSMTGLPEYRNGGLLIDFSLLIPNYPNLLTSFSLPPSPSPESLMDLPPFHASHPAMVEMRAVTVVVLERLRVGLEGMSGLGEGKLELVKVLEGGSWKAGREIAKKLRPQTGGPPFNLISDGTIF